MRLNVLLSPQNADEMYFTGKTTIVIDVLRASTTIVNALNNGAKEVIPVGSMEFAMKASGSIFGGQTILGGERNTKKIEGFTLGNSPLEYSNETVSGKSIIFFTTNGSKSIVRAKFSENLFVASFNNLKAIVDKTLELDKDLEILCAGRNGMFCMEDAICAGMICDEIIKMRPDSEINDAAKACLILNEKSGDDLQRSLSECDHGKLLIENGFSKDLEICSILNNISIVPSFISGSIKVLS